MKRRTGGALSMDHAETLAALAEWMDEAIDIPLSQADVNLLADVAQGVEPVSRLDGLSPALWEQFDEARAAFDQPLFVRTSFCSFKPEGGASRPVGDGAALRAVLGLRNARVAALLKQAEQERRGVSLFLSEWRVIPPWAEFRTFVLRRQVIGISQYHHRRSYPEITAQAEHIEARLRAALERIVPALPQESCVVDLLCAPQEKVRVIELNPFLTASDACLFTWQNGGDFDYGFRYRT